MKKERGGREWISHPSHLPFANNTSLLFSYIKRRRKGNSFSSNQSALSLLLLPFRVWVRRWEINCTSHTAQSLLLLLGLSIHQGFRPHPLSLAFFCNRHEETPLHTLVPTDALLLQKTCFPMQCILRVYSAERRRWRHCTTVPSPLLLNSIGYVLRWPIDKTPSVRCGRSNVHNNTTVEMHGKTYNSKLLRLLRPLQSTHRYSHRPCT